MEFVRYLINQRKVIGELIYSDFRAIYLSTYLGAAWAVIQPMCLIFVLWFVFEIGLRGGSSGEFPFVPWLACGLIPWFFIAECLNGGVNSVIKKGFLVRRVAFRLGLLPIVTIGVALILHAVLLVVLLALLLLYGFKPGLYWLQLPYYTGAAIALLLGISWLTSAVMVFIQDVKYFMAIATQFGFWLTPIVWPIESLPEHYQTIARLNPFNYIAEGYRNTLMGQHWFWESPGVALIFWASAAILLVVGALVFKRLRPHFADVI